MSLLNSAIENFKEKFRKIEKLSRKCVNLQGATVYILYTSTFIDIQQATMYVYMYTQLAPSNIGIKGTCISCVPKTRNFLVCSLAGKSVRMRVPDTSGG